MARMRTVKPEFWDDDVVAQLSRDARLLFIATWNAADDEGLLRWNAAYLKSTAFIYDDDLGVLEVEGLMAELVQAELIFPYQGGKSLQRLAVIIKFHSHQKINRPQPSKLIPPSLHNAQVRDMYARRDGWVCYLCHQPIVQLYVTHSSKLSLDHVHPRAHGGTDYPSNIRAVHNACNSGKGASLLDDSVNDSVNDPGTITDGIGIGSGEGSGGVEVPPPAPAAPPTKAPTKNKNRTAAPAEFEVTLPLRSWAKAAGVTGNLSVETQQFLDHHRAKGTLQVDWTAAWRTWMRNTIKWGATAPVKAPPTSGGDW